MDRTTLSSLSNRLISLIEALRSSKWTSSLAGALLAVALISTLRPSKRRSPKSTRSNDAHASDPGVLSKHSSIGPVTTSRFTYPSIRLAFHQHPKFAKLPANIPLLVFIHGLGGSAAQFVPLVTSLSNVASCLLIDLPGAGRSKLEPKDDAAYTLPAFAEIIAAAIDRFREPHQKVVLICHSLGCSVGALLASETSPLKRLLVDKDQVAGFIAICPRADPISPHQQQQLRRLRYLPIALFDVFRAWDRRGGLESKSITRFVGEGADVETRGLQMRYNAQSQSATVLKFLTALGRDDACWPDEKIWKGIHVPLFLIAAEGDTAVSPKSIDQIIEFLMHDVTVTSKATEGSHADSSSAAPAAAGDVEQVTHHLVKGEHSQPEATVLSHNETSVSTLEVERTTSHRAHVIKTTLFPKPASHGVMYSTATVRALSSLIQNFFAAHVDQRLSPAWQLNHMSTAGKWDVKNLKKWESISPISDIIAGTFRAMKTMREVDEVHSPRMFVQQYGFRKADGSSREDGVGVVIDISHETPVYDPQGLEDGGVHYHKFPTVSKLPPNPDEIAAFNALVDRLRAEDESLKAGAKVGIHCHYGFNRTGFFIICYLIERLGWSVQDAIEEFRAKRPPGIKHDYFIDELFLRYSVQLQRRGTIIR